MGFFHFHELLVLFSSGVDMIAEQNVMLAGGRCHKGVMLTCSAGGSGS